MEIRHSDSTDILQVPYVQHLLALDKIYTCTRYRCFIRKSHRFIALFRSRCSKCFIWINTKKILHCPKCAYGPLCFKITSGFKWCIYLRISLFSYFIYSAKYYVHVIHAICSLSVIVSYYNFSAQYGGRHEHFVNPRMDFLGLTNLRSSLITAHLIVYFWVEQIFVPLTNCAFHCLFILKAEKRRRAKPW